MGYFVYIYHEFIQYGGRHQIMSRIKIKDLSQDKKISKAEMKKICGGFINSNLLVGIKTLPSTPQGIGILEFQDGDDIVLRKSPGHF